MAETDAAVSGGKGIGAVLHKKLGPFPVVAWGGIGVVAGYYVYRTRKAAGSGVRTGTDGGTGGDGTVAATGSGSYSPVGSGAGNNSPGSGNGGSSTFSDNQAWSTAAISYLVGSGYEGVLANQAVQSFLASYPLTSAQQSMVNLAIGKIGPPPEAVPPSQENPNPIQTGVPEAVNGLTAKVNGPTSVTLMWEPVNGATKYRVRVSSQWGSEEWETSSTVDTRTNYGWNTTATWTVQAVNAKGAGPARSVMATTPPDPSKF